MSLSSSLVRKHDAPVSAPLILTDGPSSSRRLVPTLAELLVVCPTDCKRTSNHLKRKFLRAPKPTVDRRPQCIAYDRSADLKAFRRLFFSAVTPYLNNPRFGGSGRPAVTRSLQQPATPTQLSGVFPLTVVSPRLTKPPLL